jgi:hypothetical protein
MSLLIGNSRKRKLYGVPTKEGKVYITNLETLYEMAEFSKMISPVYMRSEAQSMKVSSKAILDRRILDQLKKHNIKVEEREYITDGGYPNEDSYDAGSLGLEMASLVYWSNGTAKTAVTPFRDA